MLRPWNLAYFLGLFFAVAVIAREDAIEDENILAKHEQIHKPFHDFLQKWNHNQDPTIRQDWLIDHQVNATIRRKRSLPISQAYPVNLNSGASQCWIPGYTGAHCEFPICQSMNKHEHEPDTAVFIAGEIKSNMTTPLFFPIDTNITTIIVKLRAQMAGVFPRMTIYDINGNNMTAVNADPNSQNPDSTGQESVYIVTWIDSNGGTNLNKRGWFYIQPTASQLTNDTGLTIYVSGQYPTDYPWPINAELGLIPNNGNNQPERDDFPQLVNNGNDPAIAWQNTLNTIVADAKYLEIPGSLTTVTIYSENAELTIPSPLRTRFGCAYKYFFDSFYCRQTGRYFARFEGYDFWGFTFWRWVPFDCMPNTTPGPTSPPTPAPSPTNPTSCSNGGVLITKSDSSTYCYCQGLFTGPTCNVRLCANGGTMTGDGKCTCPNGFGGLNCEMFWCDDTGGIDLKTPYPMIGLAIHHRNTMNGVILQIANQLPILASNFSEQPGYFDKIAVQVFNNGAQGGTLFNNWNQTYTYLDAVGSTNTDNTGGCEDNVFENLYLLMANNEISMKSPIYVFTDALPSIPDIQAYEDMIYYRNAFSNAPVYFVYVDSNSSACPVDQHDVRFQAMLRVAERTQGMVHFIPQERYNKTGEFFLHHVWGTYYKAHLVYSDDEPTSCKNQPEFQTISVDSSEKFWKLVVLVSGESISGVTISDPNGKNVNATLDYQLGTTWIYQFNTLDRGTYSVRVLSDTDRPCGFRIYTLEAPFGDMVKNIGYNLLWGVTNSINNNAPFREPYWNFPVYITARIDNYPNYTYPKVLYPEYVNAELRIEGQTPTGREFLLASNGIWRSGCLLQLFFPIKNQFVCKTPNQLLYLTFYVKDPLGYMIQRAGSMYCNNVFVTAEPPVNGTCEHSGIYFNGTCHCPPDWTGDYCQTPLCYNGGTLMYGLFCACAPGWGGDFCQFAACLVTNQNPGFDMTAMIDLALLIDTSKYNMGPANQIASSIQQTISDIRQQNPTWIESVYLVGFDGTGVTFSTIVPLNNEAAIMSDLQQIAAKAQNGPANCTVMTWEAILSLGKLKKNSIINVYQTALPDDYNVDSYVDAIYYLETNGHMLMVFGAQDRAGQFGPTQCAGTDADYGMIAEAADLSGGRFYNVRSAVYGDSLKIIPSMYSSGNVYRHVYQDCSVNNTVFAPVDSAVQSVQLIVHQYNGSGNLNVAITLPNGNPIVRSGQLFNDSVNGWTYYDVRRECDSSAGWENSNDQNDPWCYKVQLDQVTWSDARLLCWAAGGFLVDELTAKKAAKVKLMVGGYATWIGLSNIKRTDGLGYQTNGSYYWIRGQDESISYLDWNARHPFNDTSAINNQTKCVYRADPGGDGTNAKWYLDDCNQKHYYLCQKHKYSADFIPNDLNDLDLPAGRWAFTVSQGNGPCSVQVRVQSDLQIISRYTMDVHDDTNFGVQPYYNSNANRFITYVPGFDPLQQTNVPFLEAAQIYDYRNSTLYAAATYDYRVNCAYQFYSQNFSCPDGWNNVRNMFDVLHTGKDKRGIPFQRMISGRCTKQEFCGYNGYLYNAQCYCDQYRTGKNCSTPICVNGGYLNPRGDACICPTPGTAGLYCEKQYCPKPSGTTFTWTNKTWMWVVEKTVQNQPAMTSLADNFLYLAANLTNSEWFTNFVLVTFDQSGVKDNITDTNVTSFNVKLKAALTQTPTDPGNCTYPIFEALTKATQLTTVNTGSVQYLVTAGAPNDADIITNYQQYFPVMAQNQLKLFYMFVRNASGCSQDPNNKYINTLADFAYGSDGDMVIVDGEHVGAHGGTYIPTLAQSNLVGVPTFPGFDCSNLEYYFELEKHTKVIYFSTTIDSLYAKNLTLIGPLGDPINIEEIYNDDKEHVLYKAIPKGQGIYTLKLDSSFVPKPCLIEIRSTGGISIYTGYINATGLNVTYAGLIDSAQPVPLAETNVMVVHTTGGKVRLTYAEIFDPFVSPPVRTVISFYPRERCAYEWVSDVFNCQKKGLLIHVYGYDYHLQPFRRWTYTYCGAYVNGSTITTTSGTAPPVTQAATTQGPTQAPQTVSTVITTTTTSKFFTLNVDIVFLLDVSTAMTQSQLSDLSNFFVKALGYFNIATGPNNPKGTHFAILGVPGDNSGMQEPYQDGTFDTITSVQALQAAFSNAWPDGLLGPQSAGQKLLSTSTLWTISPDFINTGYRNGTYDVNNHLIIYATTKSSPDTNAINAAKQVLSSKAYSFLAFAYQSGSHSVPALAEYVNGTGCVFYPNTPEELNDQLAEQLQNKIWDASQNNGVYQC